MCKCMHGLNKMGCCLSRFSLVCLLNYITQGLFVYLIRSHKDCLLHYRTRVITLNCSDVCKCVCVCLFVCLFVLFSQSSGRSEFVVTVGLPVK